MKKIVFILLTTLILISGESFAQELSVDAPKEVNVGGIFNVNVQLSAQETLGAAFDLKFDKSAIEALSVEEGSFIKQCKSRTYTMFPPEINNTRGTIKFGDLCLGENISGTGTIATIKFKALSSGISDLTLGDARIYGANGLPISGIKVKNSDITIKSNDTLERAGNKTRQIENKTGKTENKTEVIKPKTYESLDVFISSTENIREGEAIEVSVFSAGEPVNNASATYNNITEYTDLNGSVKFIAVKGSLDIIIKKEGYAAKTILITTSGKEQVNKQINPNVTAANTKDKSDEIKNESNIKIPVETDIPRGSDSSGKLLLSIILIIIVLLISMGIYRYKNQKIKR